MDRRRRILLYALSILFLLASAVLAAIVWVLCSGWELLPDALDVLRNLEGEEILIFSFAAAGATALLSLGPYLLSLWGRRDGRPLVAIYLIAVAALAPLGGMIGGFTADEYSAFLGATALCAAVFIPAFLIYLFELIIGMAAKSLGLALESLERHGLAGRMMALARLFRPSDPVLMRRHAFTEYMAGNFARAIPIFERLRDRGEQDRKILESLEAAYRHERMWQQDAETLSTILETSPKEARFLRLLAQAYERLEQWPQALEAREAATDPRNPAQLADVARLALRAGNLERSLRHARRLEDAEGKPFKHSLEVYPEILAAYPQSIEAMEAMAALHRRMENEPKAVALWERILAQNPDRHAARRHMIDYFQRMGQLDNEEPHLRELVQRDPSDAEALLRLAANLAEQKRMDESQAMLRQGMEHFAGDFRFAIEYARQALGEGNLEEAEGALVKAELSAGKAETSRLAAIRRRLETEKNTRELNLLRQTIAQNPNEPEPRLQLIDRLSRMSDWGAVRIEFDHLLSARPDLRQQVIESLRELIESTDENYLLQDYLADLLFIDRQFAEVLGLYEEMAKRSLHREQSLIESCRKILRVAPDFRPALGRLGTLLIETQQWEKAVEANARYLELGDSFEPEKIREMIQAYLAMGLPAEAEGHAQPLLAEDPRDVDLRVSLIDAYEEKQQFEDCVRLARECAEISPANPSLQRRLDILIRKRKRQRIEELEKELAARPEDFERHFEKADLHEQFQEYDAAIGHFQRAARDPALKNLATARLGHCLALRGMFDLASETLAQVELSEQAQQEDLKQLLYESGLLFEEEGQGERALAAYKAIFRVDASFRDIVSRLSRYRSA